VIEEAECSPDVGTPEIGSRRPTSDVCHLDLHLDTVGRIRPSDPSSKREIAPEQAAIERRALHHHDQLAGLQTLARDSEAIVGSRHL
jgi:hypothetical protein